MFFVVLYHRSPRRRDTDEGKPSNGGNGGGGTFGRGGLARVQESQAAPAPRPAWGTQRTSDE